MRDLRDAPAGQVRGQAGSGDLQPLAGQELMRRQAGLALEHPAEIVVAERQRAQVGVQLEIAVRIVADDAVDDLLHHTAVLLAVLKGRDVVADQVPVGGEERNAVLRLAEMEEGGGERIQKKSFAVAPDDRGLGQGKSRIDHVDVDVGEALLTVVDMRNIRRHDDNVAGLIGQSVEIRFNDAASAGAVNKFPAGMGVSGHGIGDQVLSDINDLVHTGCLLSENGESRPEAGTGSVYSLSFFSVVNN